MTRKGGEGLNRLSGREEGVVSESEGESLNDQTFGPFAWITPSSHCVHTDRRVFLPILSVGSVYSSTTRACGLGLALPARPSRPPLPPPPSRHLSFDCGVRVQQCNMHGKNDRAQAKRVTRSSWSVTFLCVLPPASLREPLKRGMCVAWVWGGGGG